MAAHGDSTTSDTDHDSYAKKFLSYMTTNLLSNGQYINQARNGRHPLPNLIDLPDGVLTVDPDIVLWNVTVFGDADIDTKATEAMIRNIWTARPTAHQIAVLMPYTDAGLTEVQALTAAQTSIVSICSHYGVYVVTAFRDGLIATRANIPTYMADQYHPSAPAGHAEIDSNVQDMVTANPEILLPADHSVLPDRVTACADLEETAQKIDGNTGTETGAGWADVGTNGRKSSTAGDIIEFTFTGTIFCVQCDTETNPDFDMEIDGGGYVVTNIDLNGYTALLGRAIHTVRFRVRTGGSFRIDRLWTV